MGVRVDHGIGDLFADMSRITATAAARLAPVVARNTVAGRKLAQDFAKASSGRHGKLYYKRITDEMVSPLVGEYGPGGAVRGIAVGAGWRNGAGNTDLAKSADAIGPIFADEIGDTVDGFFW